MLMPEPKPESTLEEPAVPEEEDWVCGAKKDEDAREL